MVRTVQTLSVDFVELNGFTWANNVFQITLHHFDGLVQDFSSNGDTAVWHLANDLFLCYIRYIHSISQSHSHYHKPVGVPYTSDSAPATSEGYEAV